MGQKMISRMKNCELDVKIKSLAQAERGLLRELLEHVKEADLRRLYLDYGYGNLFSYLVEACGYSEGAAQRRIDAARLIKIEPGLAEKIEAGEINLSQTTLLQKAFREKSKLVKVELEEKKNLISKLSHKSHAETQVLIAQELNVEPHFLTKVTHQGDESVRLEITLTKEQWESLQRAKELASNATQSNDLGILIKYLADKLIKQKEGSAATVAVKKQVLQRDQCCQFVDPQTNKMCGSTWNLHIDHIIPKWAGGTDDAENLRVLCQEHNHYIYKQQSGIKPALQPNRTVP